MTDTARGQRPGDYRPGRGDLVGQRYLANTTEREKRDLALKITRNALQDEPAVLVDVPGGRSFLIPREAYNAVVAKIEQHQAEAAVL